jgi:hypothetical protein
VTLQNHCDIVDIFEADPGSESGCGSLDDGTAYANSDCVRQHEESHLEDFRTALQIETGRMVIETVPVSGNPPGPTCATALADHESKIQTAVNKAYDNAIALWPDEETDAEAAEWLCNCETADRICDWAAPQNPPEPCDLCPVSCDE